VAETPVRYCSNCGHELSPEDQFCSNCGQPVHRAAHVPTPDADVPVPPPPQAGGAGAAAPEQQPTQQAGWGRRHPILTGCLGVIGLFVLVMILAAALSGGGDETAEGAGGGAGGNEPAQNQDQGQQQEQQEQQAEKKPKPQPEYTVGQTATVGNVEWIITEAYRTKELKSDFGTSKTGDFIVIDFTFTNNRNEEVTLDPELHMILKDNKGQEYGPDVDAWEFVPTDLNIFLEPVNPGVSTNGRVVYQVAPEAEGFTLTVDDVEMMESKQAVYDLSGVSYNDTQVPASSASASASGGGEQGSVETAVTDYYAAVAAGDWNYTYDHLTAESQEAFTRDEWISANDALGAGATYELTDTRDQGGGIYEVDILVNSSDLRTTYFIDQGDGSFLHDLTVDEIELISGGLTQASPSASAN
jgi:hypothetical protein